MQKVKKWDDDKYSDRIDRLQNKISFADTEIKELENKLAIALATRERDYKALDLLEKCCCSESPYTQKEKRDRQVSDLVREKLKDMNDQLFCETNQYY